MIKWVTGKPRGGKGLRAMQLLADALRSGKYKRIVTNLPINLFELQTWCDSHDIDVEVDQVIVILRPESLGVRPSVWKQICRNFFLYRLPGGQPVPDQELGEELDFPNETFGILWIIDEIHKFWPSNEAASIPKRCPWLLEYLAEHAHFSDDVIFITQAPAQVTSQVRVTAQDFEIIRNKSKEKHGKFAGPDCFQIKCFLSAPTPSTPACETKHFTLKQMDGLQDCYNTSTRGGDADKGQKAKGLPFWMF